MKEQQKLMKDVNERKEVWQKRMVMQICSWLIIIISSCWAQKYTEHLTRSSASYFPSCGVLFDYF